MKPTSPHHFRAAGLIFLGLFAAFLPVILSHNYIRQDDLMWELWPGMHMSDFGYLYYNTVFQLVRPLCMLSFYITDLIAINIHDAVYVRLASIFIMGCNGFLLYRWQLLFNANKFLAGCFSVAAFTLPAYQVFVATANYNLILTALLLTFGAAFAWIEALQGKIHFRTGFYILGCVFFFLSLLEYPLSSMFIWGLLVIALLNQPNIRLLGKIALTTISLMLFYYLASRSIHWLFHVELNTRSAVLDTTHLFSRVLSVFQVFSWHADLWWWRDIHPLLHFSFIAINACFILGLWKSGMRFTSTCYTVCAVYACLLLAYSPILATAEIQVTYRYSMVTMPILLYLLYWSTQYILPFKLVRNTVYVGAALFGIVYANIMLANNIVGPHQQDFSMIQQQLKTKVIPLLQQHQPVFIHAIDCDRHERFFGYNAPQLEYGMRICQYQQQILGVIIHSLRALGYPSNNNQHNDISYLENEIAINNTPWGMLVVNHDPRQLQTKQPYHTTLVTIDTRAMPAYAPFSFYHSLLEKYQL